MEAHGHAQLGNTRECILALQTAEREFVPPNDNTPQWLSYFDEAYLSAKFGHVLRDLGRPAAAERFARQSLNMRDGYDRGRMFNTALLAWTLADQGAADEAASHAREAAELAAGMSSARASAYIAETTRSMTPYRTSAAVHEFLGLTAPNPGPVPRRNGGS
jgi:hypothetical protein